MERKKKKGGGARQDQKVLSDGEREKKGSQNQDQRLDKVGKRTAPREAPPPEAPHIHTLKEEGRSQ